MSRLTSFAVAAAIVCFAAVPALAQQAIPAYGTPITLDQATKMIAAAEAEAKKNNWPVAISIVDTGGHLVAMHRLDNTQIGSIKIAEGKARTAVELRRPTKALEDAIAGGGSGARVLAIPGVMPLEGGIPIMAEGKVIGGIGVSGVLSGQDAQVARAGLEGLK
jgi:glc operon protein GlcG